MKKFITAILVASMLMVGSKASAQTWTAAGGYTTFSLMVHPDVNCKVVPL